MHICAILRNINMRCTFDILPPPPDMISEYAMFVTAANT